MSKRNGPYATLEPDEQGMLVLRTSYCPELTDDLKRVIPAQDRRGGKDDVSWRWLIAPKHAETVVSLVQTHIGVTLQSPSLELEQEHIVVLDYLGKTYLRQDGRYTASGASGSLDHPALPRGDGSINPRFLAPQWTHVFPERVLREWDNNWSGYQPDHDLVNGTVEEQAHQNSQTDNSQPIEDDKGYTLPPTYYAVLGLKEPPPDYTDEQMKKTFRRLSTQWHPDVSQEPDAVQKFQEINEAYQALRTDGKRAFYDKARRLVADGMQRMEEQAERFQRQEARSREREEQRRRWQEPVQVVAPMTITKEMMEQSRATGYRSHNLCGLLTVRCIPDPRGWFVTKILAWDEHFIDRHHVVMATYGYPWGSREAFGERVIVTRYLEVIA